MNTNSPNSPENRMIEELLHEQSKGPDEDFIKQVEAALDAGSRPAVERQVEARAHHAGRKLAIAAGICLLAGGLGWYSYQRGNGGRLAGLNDAALQAKRAEVEKARAQAMLEQLDRAIRDQEVKVEERRKALAAIVRDKTGSGNAEIVPSLLEKLMYVKDESLGWVLLPTYGSEGKFPVKYEDTMGATNKSDAANLIGPGDIFFRTGPMANRFKLLGSEVRRELNKNLNIEQEVTYVRIEDQKPNKKGAVYEFPAPLNDQRKNQFLRYDRTAVFSLEEAGMEGKEFKVEENAAFSLPPGGEKKDFILKSVTPAGVVVEIAGGGKTVEIQKGAMPAGQALAELAANSPGGVSEDAIKRGLDAQNPVDAKRDYDSDKELLAQLKVKQAEMRSAVNAEGENSGIGELADARRKKGLARIMPEVAKSDGVAASAAHSSHQLPESKDAFADMPSLAGEPRVASERNKGMGVGSGGGSGLGPGAPENASGGPGDMARRASHEVDESSAMVMPSPERQRENARVHAERARREDNYRQQEMAQRAEMTRREEEMRIRYGDLARNARRREMLPSKRGMIEDSREMPPAAVEAPSGDKYGTFVEQPWKTAARDPLSTFSIDVDTASYANVRRMIQEGRTVPKDAVRIEEFINAFKYHYPAPKGDAAFAVGATLAVCPWAPEHQIVRVAIKGREVEAAKRPASNLVFLIDVSGSMNSPDKLPLLIQSMQTMVAGLDERDRVAIVVYAGSEGVALPSTRLDEEGRAKVLAKLERLNAGGSTNGGAGIKRAYQIAMEQKIEGGTNRVILATDGDFNVGLTGQQQLVEMVKERAKGGVYLTVAGFGSGNLNDAMMDAITRDGNGNYFYIDSAKEGEKVFLKNLAGTIVTIAKDVKIQVEFNPAKVGGYRLIGYANRVLKNEDFANDKVDAGDIGAGHTVTAFYEISAPGAVPGGEGLKYQAPAVEAAPGDDKASGEWMTVKLRHKHPEGDESRLTEFALTGEAAAVDQTDRDFQFATAAALFGMKLRGAEEVKETPWKRIVELATPGLADDPDEDRAEFVKLVRKSGGVVDLEADHDAAPQASGVDSSTDAGFNAVEGPNVRMMRHEDGSRSIFTRSTDRRTLVKRKFSAAGVLLMRSTYKMDSNGNPLGCKIADGQGNELFRVSYGYDSNTGYLVSELMFDSRSKRINPDNGTEMPVQRVVYLYDEKGKRGAPVVYNLLPGKTFEEIFGEKGSALAFNPFDVPLGKGAPAAAEVVPGGSR